MDIKDYLTNEKIRKRFHNQFDLVNYAIKLAENMIISGRDPRVKTDSQNRSLQVLTEILHGKDHLDDLTPDTDSLEESVVIVRSKEKIIDDDEVPQKTSAKAPTKAIAKTSLKGGEGKKPRKAAAK